MQELQVKGMHCQHCSAAVHKALSAIEGVDAVQVDLASGRVTYTVKAAGKDGQGVDGGAIKQAAAQAIRDAGFDVV